MDIGGIGAVGGIEVVEGSSTCCRGIDGGGIGICVCIDFDGVGFGNVPFPFPTGTDTGGLRAAF